MITVEFGDGLTWSKSRRSGDQGGGCVCVTTDVPGAVGVRDSKDPTRPAQWYSPQVWGEFLAEVRGGRFDLH